MKHLDIFSGIGGFALAASRVWKNHKIHYFVEKDPFCIEVLRKHWPGVPIHENVITYKHNGENIDLITAGFPCQPYSSAGIRRGEKDKRALWRTTASIIREVKPTWAVCENVYGFAHMELVPFLIEMEKNSYKSEVFSIPAYAVGKSHNRQRLWIVSHANSDRKPGSTIDEEKRVKMGDKPAGMGRKVNGIPGRMDKRKRLKALGNSIIPQIAEIIFKTMKHTGYQAGPIQKKDVKK